MDLENTELSQKNSQNEKQLQELSHRLAGALTQKEEEPGHSAREQCKLQVPHRKEELEQCRVQVRRRATLQLPGTKSQEIKQ